MTAEQRVLARTAADLRREFDRTFAEPRSTDIVAEENFLIARVAAETFAIRSAQIAGVFVNAEIVPLPGKAPALLGIVGFRSSVLPVFDLRAQLGQPAETAPRWLLIAAAAPVAFAFDILHGQQRIPTADVVARNTDRPVRRHVLEYVQDGDLVRPVLDLASLVSAIVTESPRTAP